MENKNIKANGNSQPIISRLESGRKNESNIFQSGQINQAGGSERKIFEIPNKKKILPKSQPVEEGAAGDIFGGKPEISKKEIYEKLMGDKEFHMQALKEGKKPWQLAKELTEKFAKGFGGFISKSEAKKQLNEYDYWKIIHEQQKGKPTYEKSRKTEQDKQERNFLKKKFGV